MQIPFDALKHRLIRVMGGEIDPNDLTTLVHLSRVIVQSHLEHVRTSSLWLCRQQGITVEDMAFDCVGEVFRRNGDGRFVTIEAFAGALKRGIEGTPSAEVFFAYRKLLTTIANQRLAHLFAENDPAGGKIFRNLTGALKKSTLFDVDRDLRGVVIRPRNRNPRDELPEFPAEEMSRLLFGATGKNRSITELLKDLHGVLTGQKLYRQSVTLLEVTGVFKRLFSADLTNDENVAPAPFDDLSELDLDMIRGEVETVVRQKILLTYVVKGKMGVEEARAISDTFHDLLVDWIRSGKATDGIMRYLQRHQPMDEATYRKEYRPKMEYLLRIAREAFEARLVREL